MDTRKLMFPVLGRQEVYERFGSTTFHGIEVTSSLTDSVVSAISRLEARCAGFPFNILVVASADSHETNQLLEELLARVPTNAGRIWLLQGTDLPLDSTTAADRIVVISTDDWIAKHVTFDLSLIPRRGAAVGVGEIPTSTIAGERYGDS